MKVRLKNNNGSIKCPKCGKLMKSQWFGYRCSQCNYEQLNSIGRDAFEEKRESESLTDED